MTIKKINNKLYNIDDFVEYINPETGKRHGIPVFIVQPGFELFVDGKTEMVYSIEYSDYSHKDKQLYFLHIPKTSGMSLKKELLFAFKHKTVFSNFIYYLNDYQMLNSDFISGHFATYPVNLLKENNKNLITYTIMRDPVERFVSNFLYYKKTIIEKRLKTLESKSFLDHLDEYINNEYNHNLQSKSITSTLDTDFIEKSYSEIQNGAMDLDQYYILLSQNKYMKQLDKDYIDAVDDIDIIDILEFGKNFERLDNLLKDFNVEHNIDDIVVNKSTESTKDIIDKLPKSMLQRIIDSNSNDIELYEYVATNRKAG